MVSLLAFVTGRLFVGQELARDPAWHKLSIVYTLHAFVSAIALRSFNPRLRPVVKYFLPPVRQVWKDFSEAAEILAPVIKKRLSDAKKPGWEDYEKPNDSLQWILDSVPESAKEDYAYHARSQLGLTAVAIHNTANLAIYTFYELAARPEDIEMLRQEVKDVIEVKYNGRFTTEALYEYGHPVLLFPNPDLTVVHTLCILYPSQPFVKQNQTSYVAYETLSSFRLLTINLQAQKTG